MPLKKCFTFPHLSNNTMNQIIVLTFLLAVLCSTNCSQANKSKRKQNVKRGLFINDFGNGQLFGDNSRSFLVNSANYGNDVALQNGHNVDIYSNSLGLSSGAHGNSIQFQSSQGYGGYNLDLPGAIGGYQRRYIGNSFGRSIDGTGLDTTNHAVQNTQAYSGKVTRPEEIYQSADHPLHRQLQVPVSVHQPVDIRPESFAVPTSLRLPVQQSIEGPHLPPYSINIPKQNSQVSVGQSMYVENNIPSTRTGANEGFNSFGAVNNYLSGQYRHHGTDSLPLSSGNHGGPAFQSHQPSEEQRFCPPSFNSKQPIRENLPLNSGGYGGGLPLFGGSNSGSLNYGAWT